MCLGKLAVFYIFLTEKEQLIYSGIIKDKNILIKKFDAYFFEISTNDKRKANNFAPKQISLIFCQSINLNYNDIISPMYTCMEVLMKVVLSADQCRCRLNAAP